MIADPLAKSMDPERMVNTLMTGKLDLRPTPESLMVKEKNRQHRRNKKEIDKQFKEGDAKDEMPKKRNTRRDGTTSKNYKKKEAILTIVPDGSQEAELNTKKECDTTEDKRW